MGIRTKGYYFALLKLGKNKDVLYVEYKRAKRGGLKKSEIEKEIIDILEETEGRSPLIQAQQIVAKLLSLGTEEGEMNAETKKHR